MAGPGQGQVGLGMPDPINALQNLASQGSRNPMINMGPQPGQLGGPLQATASNLLQTLNRGPGQQMMMGNMPGNVPDNLPMQVSELQLDGKNILSSIANILNSMQRAEKKWDDWRKTWQDLRSHTKIKAEGNKKKANETGGGPSDSKEDSRSEMEKDILEIVKKVSIEGHGANESSTSFDFNANNSDINNFILKSDLPINDFSNISSNEMTCDKTTHTIQEKEYEYVRDKANTSCTQRKKLKKLPKRIENLVNSATAPTSFKENLEKKVNVKEKYYKEKLKILKQIKGLKKRKVIALERIGDSLLRIANSMP